MRSTLASASVVAALASLLVSLWSSGCGAPSSEAAVDLGRPNGSSGSCATPNEGCPCSEPGRVVDCGNVEHTYDGYVACSPGKRTCTGTTWGTCLGDAISTKSIVSTKSIGIATLGAPTACTSNPCDPYCQQIVDDGDGGVDAGGFGLDGGLTLDGGAGSGGVGAPCMPSCTGNQTCVNGTCKCPLYQSLCGGTCKPTTVDPNNCGGCGVVCSGATPICTSGACRAATACTSLGMSSCGGGCVDTFTDNANCGGCGNVCPAGTGCVLGAGPSGAGGCRPQGAPCLGNLTGRILDPRKVNPIPNVNVYVPTTPVAAFPAGVQCESCATLITGNPTISAVTDYKGDFTLTGVPAKTAFNLVIQTGRWRRQVSIPATLITSCGQTASLPAAMAHLPATHTKTGDTAADIANPDLPKMAMVTGDGDQLECLMRKIGVDDTEFTAPAGTGNFHMYRYNGMSMTGVGAATTLWDNLATMKSYNLIVEPCHNQATNQVSSLETDNHAKYANAGGRIFMSHRYGPDIIERSAAAVAPGISSLASTVNWAAGALDASSGTDSTDRGPLLTDDVLLSPSTFTNWLQFVGASTTPNKLDIHNYRHDIDSVNAPSIAWAYGNSASLGHAGGGPLDSIVSFDTPVGLPAASQCGRVVLPIMHVTQISPHASFPTDCAGTAASTATMSSEEKAFEYMFFQSTACLGNTLPPPAPTCAGGGPPIVLPGSTQCTSSLATQVFDYGINSCTDFSSSQTVFQDSFDSGTGPYAPGTAGGGLAGNGGCSFSHAGNDIEGELYCAGTTGANTNAIVRGDVHSGGNFSGGANVTGNAYVVGTASGVTVSGTTTHPASVAPPISCAPIPVSTYTTARATTNDNATIGLDPAILSSGGNLRIDLPCGNFYLNQITTSQAVTIYAHGRTALFIGGDVMPSQPLAFGLDPGAELDIFVAGVVDASQLLQIGNTNYPAATRMYVGGGTTPNVKTVNLTQVATLNGNIWAAGLFRDSQATTMYGSVFANSFNLSQVLNVHYDSAVRTVDSSSCVAQPHYTAQTFSRDFHATCPPGNRIVWQLFSWQALLPVGTQIVFKAQTAADVAGAPGTYGPAVGAGTALPPDTVTWTSDAHTIEWHLENDIAATPQTSLDWLRVSMTLTPDMAGSLTPTLQTWRQTFDCVPSE